MSFCQVIAECVAGLFLCGQIDTYQIFLNTLDSCKLFEAYFRYDRCVAHNKEEGRAILWIQMSVYHIDGSFPDCVGTFPCSNQNHQKVVLINIKQIQHPGGATGSPTYVWAYQFHLILSRISYVRPSVYSSSGSKICYFGQPFLVPPHKLSKFFKILKRM